MIAAIVGGLFTIAPIVYDYVKNQRSLSYELRSSAVLEGGTDKQIFILDIENSGAQTLRNLVLTMELPNGTFSDISFDAPRGVDVSLETSGPINAQVAELNSGEGARLAFMAESENLFSESVSLSIRATDLPSSSITEKSDQFNLDVFVRENPLAVFSFLAAYLGIGTVVMVKWRSRLAWRLRGRPEIDRDVALSYIGRSVLDPEEYEDYFTTKSWVEAADSVFIAGEKGQVEQNKAVQALACMLRLREQINPRSLAVISRHIATLDGLSSDVRLKDDFFTGDVRADLDRVSRAEPVSDCLESEGKAI